MFGRAQETAGDESVAHGLIVEPDGRHRVLRISRVINSPSQTDPTLPQIPERDEPDEAPETPTDEPQPAPVLDPPAEPGRPPLTVRGGRQL